MKRTRLLYFAALYILSLFIVRDTQAQSEFIKYELNHGITIELPAKWEIVPKQVTDQINIATESISKTDQGNNDILIAANCYTLQNKPSATIRVSLRSEVSASQQDMKDIPEDIINGQTKAQLANILNTVRKQQPDFVINDASGRKEIIGSKISMVQEYTSNLGGADTVVSRLHIINDGNRRIKIQETYKLEEAAYFKPIFAHIESSLLFR